MSAKKQREISVKAGRASWASGKGHRFTKGDAATRAAARKGAAVTNALPLKDKAPR